MRTKVAIVLVVLGITGIGQYVYFQFTPLAYTYEYYTYYIPGVPYEMIGVNMIRNWGVGLAGAIVGIMLLGIGIYRLRRCRAT